jgi:hypothetical protein
MFRLGAIFNAKTSPSREYSRGSASHSGIDSPDTMNARFEGL